ncbi:hypothetical protein [Actinoplanes sp. G11-F43]|uniref:hypothetical protein n=1 Tax=Actinoplanes sp. G11-F43 TaxID=3424130 RepID=UPI003D355F8C
MDVAGHPIPVLACWLSWLAVATSDQAEVVRAYLHSEQNDGEAWLIAERPEAAIGEPFGIERDLLDAFGITGKPEDLDPDEDLASSWAATWGDCWATTIAAGHSLDPTALGPSTPSAGAVLIAGTPSAGR